MRRRNAILRWFEGLGRPAQVSFAFVLLGIVAWLDHRTGAELSFSIFYLAPIALVSWFSGRKLGVGFALAAAFLWYGAEISNDKIYTEPSIAYWNTGVRLGFFLIINYLITTVHAELRRVQRLSQSDHLTGAVNRRHFSELAESELDRVDRYKRPLSLAYIDLDNFKSVNDQQGHEAGDDLLKCLVELLRGNLRKPDIVARIGGDEFLVLMPETTSEQARNVIDRILSCTRESMRAKNLPVALSVGVVTSSRKVALDELIKVADSQMYLSKQSGKDRAHYQELDPA